MRTISKPTEKTEDFFLKCISIVNPPSLKGRLEATKNLIVSAAQEFDTKVTTGTMHTIVRESIVNGDVSKKELELVYTYRMAKLGTPGRDLYVKIRTSAKLGICPLCAHREASTIDHYLPKTEYPRLSVTPINLIPACKDCNEIKDNFYPTLPEHEFIHPYYDDIEDINWLKAEIQHSNPCVIKYSVETPATWPTLLTDRVKFHFTKLNLAKLYSVQAAVELAQIRRVLNKRLAESGMHGVKQYLQEAEETRSHDYVNSWQSVFYKAAANDNWFCNGGFLY